MSSFPKLTLFRQEHPPTSMPWRVGEIYMTTDGPRSRLCSGAFKTEEQARAHMRKLEAKQKEIQR